MKLRVVCRTFRDFNRKFNRIIFNATFENEFKRLGSSYNTGSTLKCGLKYEILPLTKYPEVKVS